MFVFVLLEIIVVCGFFEIFIFLFVFFVLLKIFLYSLVLLEFLWIVVNWVLYRRVLKFVLVKCLDMLEIVVRLVFCVKRRDLDKVCRIFSFFDWKIVILKCLELFYVLVKLEIDG